MAYTTWAGWTDSAKSSRSRTSRSFTPNGKAVCWPWYGQWAQPAHSTSIPRATTGRCLRPDVYLASSYYRKWLLGLEDMLVDKGFVSTDDVAAGHAVRPPKSLKHGKFGLGDVERVMVRGKFGRPSSAPAKFKAGDRVRARNIHPATHTQAAALRARSCRHGRARSWVSCVPGYGGHRIRREPAMALHGRVRRAPNCGGRMPTRPQRFPSMPSSRIWRRHDGNGSGPRDQRRTGNSPRR